jgi:hypothetical protein
LLSVPALTPAQKVTNRISTLISLIVGERSEAKKRRVKASRQNISNFDF